jgi:hypothetical protein
MGLRDAAKALTEDRRAARSAIPEWNYVTPRKLWPKAGAQPGARSHEWDRVKLQSESAGFAG